MKIVIALVVLAGIAGSVYLMNTQDPSTPSQDVDKDNPSSTKKTYPPLYGNELPKYPGATLTDTGRQQSSLKDGLKLQLSSKDEVRSIANHYEEKMKALGWTIPKQRVPNDKMYVSRYTKGNLVYQIKIMRLSADKDTQITINYLEN